MIQREIRAWLGVPREVCRDWQGADWSGRLDLIIMWSMILAFAVLAFGAVVEILWHVAAYLGPGIGSAWREFQAGSRSSQSY